MNIALIILIIEAISVYLLFLWVHSLRHRAGLGPFYALLGGITAIMSWTTDAGVQVEVAGITFMVGSTVFYTALLLGVFVVYVFDGPRSTQCAILTVAGISALVPIIAAALHLQMDLSSSALLNYIPTPSLRINTASVLTTIIDLVFLAMMWEVLGKPKLKITTWLRAYLTLLGVMVLDVALFNTGAFFGTPNYLSIMQGTLLSRLVLSVFAFPFLYFYLNWQSRKRGVRIENRPVLAILRKVEEVRSELQKANRELERRKQAEKREEFLHSILRHDVKNKLQVAKGYVQLMEKESDNEKTYHEKISKAINAAVEIIEKVSTLRKIEAQEEIGAVEIRRVVESVVSKHVDRLHDQDIEIEVQILPCTVKGGSLLDELFSNLIENAITHAVCHKIRVSTKSKGDCCIITVEDDGKGISDEMKEKIFEQGFKKGEKSGSGLGTYIAKDIAEKYGGSIEVKDSGMGGARFDVRLKKAA